jgi:hypothetical protein
MWDCRALRVERSGERAVQVRIALMAQADDGGCSGTVTSAGWGGGKLSTNDETDVAQRMEQAIRRYYAACNTGDAEAVAAFFTPGAVHYVPPGYGGSPRGGLSVR